MSRQARQLRHINLKLSGNTDQARELGDQICEFMKLRPKGKATISCGNQVDAALFLYSLACVEPGEQKDPDATVYWECNRRLTDLELRAVNHFFYHPVAKQLTSPGFRVQVHKTARIVYEETVTLEELCRRTEEIQSLSKSYKKSQELRTLKPQLKPLYNESGRRTRT